MNWISVKDRLPEIRKGYYNWFVVWGTSNCHCSRDTNYYLASLNSDGSWQYGEYDCPIEVTHWMKPEAPHEK